MSDLSNDIERYRKNQMTDAERHALEKKALNDPFLADALEGAETVEPTQFRGDLDSLNRRFVSSRKPGYAFALRLAAGFAILVTVSWMVWRTPETKTVTEQLTGNADSTAGPAGDSSEQLLTLSKPVEETQEENSAKKNDQAPATTTAPAAGPVATQPTTEAAADELKETEATKDLKTTQALVSESRRIEEAPRVVTGKVTEAESGVVLPGAVIRDPDSQKETRAAADGSYSIPVTSDTVTLQYSYPGLQTLEKTAGNAAANDVALRDDTRQRSEVIVFPSAPAAEKQESRASAKRSVSSGESLATTLAVPVDGLEAFQRYLEQNQRIPEAARAANVHGKVTVSFTVEANGAIKDITVLKSVGAGCDEELIRLVQQGPAWTPSREAGKPVSSTVWVKLEF